MTALFARVVPSAPPGDSPSCGVLRDGEAQLDTAAGRVLLRCDDPYCVTQGVGFAAAWTDAFGPLNDNGLASLRSLRPRSLVAATPDGVAIERGPYGGAPVYYAEDDKGGAVISSRLAPLVAALPARPRLDVDALAACGVAEFSLDPRATIYQGVRRLLSCEALFRGADGVRSSLRLPTVPEVVSRDPRESARQMRELLSTIVAEVLRRFPAVAVLTGGGVDSSGLLALFVREAAARNQRVTGLTVDVAGRGDDRPHLRVLLRHLGASTLRVFPDQASPMPRGYFVHDAAPFTTASAPLVRLFYDRARAWGADALVAGHYGDTILDGDLQSFAGRVRRGELGAILDVARLQIPWMTSPARRVVEYVAKPVLRSWLPDEWLARRRQRWLAAHDVWRWAGPRLRQLLPHFLGEPVIRGDDRVTWMATSQESTERFDVMGQMEVAGGIPTIGPYEDPRFIEFVLTIPPEQLFFGHRNRGLFRAAMQGLVPDSVRLRPDKASMEGALEQMFVAIGGFGSLGTLLTMEATADLGLVEPAPFRAAMAELVAGRAHGRGWPQQWSMLAVEAFVRRHCSAAPAADEDA